jgi:hypothetical protein
MKEKKFVFVCGMHRSGTSVLFKSLRQHPKLSGFVRTGTIEDEGQHLQSAIPSDNAYGGVGRFGFSAQNHWTEESPWVTNAVREKLYYEWGQFWNLNAEVLLEKSPPNIIHTRFLQALFPNSYFILIKRHPVATSYATRMFAGKKRFRFNLYTLFKHRCLCHDIFEKDKAYLKNVYEIRYEDFVQDPDKYMDEIYQFIGINSCPSGLEIKSATNVRYFDEWRKLSDRKMLKLYVKQLKRVFEEKIKRHGYQL